MIADASAAVKRAIVTRLDVVRARRARDPEWIAQAALFDDLARQAVPVTDRYDLTVGLTLAYEYELEHLG